MEKKDALFSSKKEKWDFVIAIVVITLVAFFIYSKTYTNSDAAPDSTPLFSATTTDTTPITNSYTKEDCPDTDSYKSTIEPVKTTNITPVHSYNDTFTSSSDNDSTPNTLQTTTTIPTQALETQIPETSTVSQITEETQEIVQETEQNIKVLEVKEVPLKETSVKIDTIVTQTLQEKTPVINKNALENTTIQNQTATNTTQTDCLVIIGAYQEEVNEIAAITKLTELGYSHEVGTMRNQLRFVGVPVACDDKKQKRILIRELNPAFGISAWVKEK